MCTLHHDDVELYILHDNV